MKKRILEIIYTAFAEWTAVERWACTQGCATCCTQNVTITALEGAQILNHVISHGNEQWFAEKLSARVMPFHPSQTMNEYAQICLNGDEPPEDSCTEPVQACPFLESGSCTIYEVRPFSCRCFLSQERCTPSRPALVENKHLAASTAVSQLIEHLGQFEYWGNMLDVLPAMLDISKYQTIRRHLKDPSLADNCRLQTLKAKPLPGFLLGPDDYQEVAPLLEEVFNAKIEGKTVEAILNGAA